jgi:urease accessory protein
VLLLENDKMIIIEYEPEDVLGFKIKDELSNNQKIAIAIKLGHIIGNLHRPISMKDGVTYVPIQSDAEIANIKEILLPIIDYIDIQHARIIFEQELGTKVHVH